MLVEDLMTHAVHTIGMDQTLDEAAAMMWKHDCGALPVVNDRGEAVAMLTDRDICMHAWSQGTTLRDLRVRGAMSAKLIVCRSSDTVARAESLMQMYQIRRVPVVDSNGVPVGLLSLSDLSREALYERAAARPEVSEDDVVSTLAAISSPRSIGVAQTALGGSA